MTIATETYEAVFDQYSIAINQKGQLRIKFWIIRYELYCGSTFLEARTHALADKQTLRLRPATSHDAAGF